MKITQYVYYDRTKHQIHKFFTGLTLTEINDNGNEAQLTTIMF